MARENSQARSIDGASLHERLVADAVFVSRATTPNRLLDGIDLTPVIDGQAVERPSPLCFWSTTPVD